MIKVEVARGGYPLWIRLIAENGNALSLDHRELLQLEHALAEAKKHILCELPRNMWHEVDPKLAGVA
jgi:hypothetical protein